MKRHLTLICLSLLIAFTVSAFSSVMADTSGTAWDGIYSTNLKESGTNGSWASPNVMLISWGKEVQYGGTPISNAKFFNNSSIIWTGDSNWGNGQIWFTSGDNRSFYWPNGAVTGRVFTGKIDAIPGISVDFRGLNNSLYSNDAKDNNKCVGASCPTGTNSCGPCSNGKVCSNGECVCPGGTSDCFGQCITVAPCGGGCANGKVCINGQCVCPSGTKECNDLCIKVAECCDGCPPWQVCSSGRCVCPPGVKDCSDPLPL